MTPGPHAREDNDPLSSVYITLARSPATIAPRRPCAVTLVVRLRMRAIDRLAQVRANGVELGFLRQREIAWTRKGHAHVLDDGRRLAAHHQHPIRQEHRLADAVRNEQSRLAIFLPQIEQ